jgi:acetyltransferase-like isoleucine patch superfamily enzyme
MDILAVLYNKFLYRPYVRRRLKHAGRGFRLGYSSEFLQPGLFQIGDNFFTGPHCYFDTNEFSPVRIGDDVMFGPYCKLIGGNHDYSYTKGPLAENRFPRPHRKEIVIENGAWIGANAVILTGAQIGEGSVIGAMGLVNHFIPPYTVAVGVPAKRLFARFRDDKDLADILRNVGSHYTVEIVRALQNQHGVEVERAR